MENMLCWPFRKSHLCENSFVLMPPIAGLHSDKLCATYLVFVGLAAAEFLVWDGALTPGMVHEASQQLAGGGQG